jgi:hypothetical protein
MADGYLITNSYQEDRVNKFLFLLIAEQTRQ